MVSGFGGMLHSAYISYEAALLCLNPHGLLTVRLHPPTLLRPAHHAASAVAGAQPVPDELRAKRLLQAKCQRVPSSSTTDFHGVEAAAQQVGTVLQ